ncbi:hypothetical protein [Pseudomonas sp. SCB32]|uniref:hypothetical protein n=1 Tax=Pseudomonas sp. SCB32 TaxID=2653853 RepID=UPI0012641E96|nr:hypothetical protein [Pseudomonas sp. SCB32]
MGILRLVEAQYWFTAVLRTCSRFIPGNCIAQSVGGGSIVDDRETDSLEETTDAFLALLPALADVIERSIPLAAAIAEVQLHRQQKAWTELCHMADQVGLSPFIAARLVVLIYRSEQRRSAPADPS